MNNHDLLLHSFFDGFNGIVKYNTTTREVEVLDITKPNFVSRTRHAEDFFRDFVRDAHVYEDDIPKFRQLNRDHLLSLCKNGENGVLISYRCSIGGSLIWRQLSLLIPSTYSDAQPWILFYDRDMPQEESIFYESLELSSVSVLKALKANLTTNDFFIIKEQPFEAHLKRNHPGAEYMIEYIFSREEFVHPDDSDLFARHMDPDFIRNYFRKGNPDYTFYYRRLVCGTYRWVKLLVLPASEYSLTNEVFFCYVIDVNRQILSLLDFNAASSYAQFIADKAQHYSEAYYDHLLQIVARFTQRYIEYYTIDLERDLYVNYKTKRNPLDPTLPHIGSYTQLAREFVERYFPSDTSPFEPFSSSEKLRELLKDKLTLTHRFLFPDGTPVVTTYLKVESKNGIPTKLLCSTEPCGDSNRLKIRTFGNFEVMHPDGTPLRFSRKHSKQLLAYLVDRNGFPVTSKDIVMDILEKEPGDLNALKYASALIRRLMDDLAHAGYEGVVIKEQRTIRLDTTSVDCDYYHLLDGDTAYWSHYHNEYMKEYSWAEETNAELLHITDK